MTSIVVDVSLTGARSNGEKTRDARLWNAS